MGLAVVAVMAMDATAVVPTSASPAGPVARIACTHAKIGGQSKCLARGQFCTPGYQRQYKRYGFSCSRDSRGRYRLR
jgi:hypothetical protein